MELFPSEFIGHAYNWNHLPTKGLFTFTEEKKRDSGNHFDITFLNHNRALELMYGKLYSMWRTEEGLKKYTKMWFEMLKMLSAIEAINI